jgi:cation diffusion facilitator family transporter
MAGERKGAERVALFALAITGALTIAKVGVWLTTSSLVILSQALDSAIDLVALGLVLVAVRVASKPADESHQYGHGKAENLVAFAQTVFLGLIVIAVFVEAISRLIEGSAPPEVPWYAIALLAASAAIDVVRVAWMMRVARREGSDALRAGALNIATDIGTASVALLSLLLVRAGWEGADAVGSLIVAFAVAVAAVRLGRKSVDVLMDRAPDEPSEAIQSAAARAPGVAETRRVRVRSAGNQLFADVTVAAGRTSSLERAHDIAEQVEQEIEKVAPGTDVVVHVEPISETTGIVERVQAAASREQGVHEVHNVVVHAFDEQGRRKLHVTLHAKVREGMSLEEAHDLSERVEEAVTSELGPDVRVDSHMEPLRSTEFGRDVTSEREEIVSSVRGAALKEPDVLDCHEVLVTSTAGLLSVVAHVRARGDLPLGRIHDASEHIETEVRARHPEVGQVLIHFEPA